MVHRARLGVRLLVVGLVMLVSFGVTAAVVWFAVFSRDDSGSDRVAGTTSVAVGRPGSSTGVALPTGWPETFAPPSGARVISAVATSAGTPEEQFVVVYEVPGELSAVAGVMRGQLVGGGFTITNDSAGEIDQPTSLIATGGGKDAIVSVAPTPARPEVATVTWILRPTS